MDVSGSGRRAPSGDRHRNVQAMTNNELRESMWELCYDLLPAAERAALIARIKSDPQAARLYAEVRLQADLVAAASVVEDDSLVVSPPSDMPDDTLHPSPDYVAASVASPPTAAPLSRPRKRDAENVPARRISHSSRQSLHWVLATAALVLLGVMGYGAIRPLQSQHALADRFVVTEVEAPARMQAGLSNKVVLKSKTVLGRSVEAHVDLKVLAPEGTVLFHEGVPTSEQGEATVEIPGTALVPGARLEAAGRSRRLAHTELEMSRSQTPGSSSVAMDLPIEAEPPLTYFWLESPLAADDQPVRYAAVNLDRFSLRPVPAAPNLWAKDAPSDADSKFGAAESPETLSPETLSSDSLSSKSQATTNMRGVARSEQPLDAYLVEGTFKRQSDHLARDSRLDSLAMSEQLVRRSGTSDGAVSDGALSDNTALNRTAPNNPAPTTRALEFRGQETPPKPSAGVAPTELATKSGEAQRPPAPSGPESRQLASGKKEAAKLPLQAQDKTNPAPGAGESLAESAGTSRPSPAGALPAGPAPGHLSGGGIGGAAAPRADSIAGGFAGGLRPGEPASGDSAPSTEGSLPTDAGSEYALGALTAGAMAASPGPESLAEANSPLALKSLPIVAAGEPVTVELSQPLADRKLLLQAINRDVVVASRKLNEPSAASDRRSAEAESANGESSESRQKADGVRQFSLSLPPEADGEVQVEVLDLEQSPPQVVESYAYYRQPARELQIDFVSPNQPQARFAPGDVVQLRLRVQNEHGEASPAALGVRVWNETVIQQTGEPVLLAEHVRRSQRLGSTRLSMNEPRVEAKEASRTDSLAMAGSQPAGAAPGTMSFAAGSGSTNFGGTRVDVPPSPPAPPFPSPTSPLAASPADSPRFEATRSAPAEPAQPSPANKIANDVAAELALQPAAPSPAEKPLGASDEAAAGSSYAPVAPIAGHADLESMSKFADTGSVISWDYDAEPMRASNGLDISSEYQSQQSALEAKWRTWRAIVGRILVIAGIVLMIGLAIQLWIRMPTRVLSATLAMTAAAASLVVGAMWMDRSPPGYEVATGQAVESQIADNRPAPAAAPRSMAPTNAAAETTFTQEPQAGYGLATPAPAESLVPLAGEAPSPIPERSEEDQSGAAAASTFGREKSLPARPADGVEPGEDRPLPETESLAGREPSPDRLANAAPEDPQSRPVRGDSSGAGAGDLAMERAAKQGSGRGAAGAALPGGIARSDGPAAVRMRSDAPPPALPATASSPPPAELTPLAATPDEAPPPSAAIDDPAASARKLSQSESRVTAPASLYFNPRLATDERGFATFTFQMPAAESDYRILVDAIGDGRIGSREFRIQCRAEPPPAGEAAGAVEASKAAEE
jgi:hypothetical protein